MIRHHGSVLQTLFRLGNCSHPPVDLFFRNVDGKICLKTRNVHTSTVYGAKAVIRTRKCGDNKRSYVRACGQDGRLARGCVCDSASAAVSPARCREEKVSAVVRPRRLDAPPWRGRDVVRKTNSHLSTMSITIDCLIGRWRVIGSTRSLRCIC